MSAYSNIDTGRINARHRMASRKFRQGVREGFGSPALFWATLSFTRTEGIDASIGKVWKRVGDALNTATAKKGEEIGKSSRQTAHGNAAHRGK